jgi:hypothetical protein
VVHIARCKSILVQSIDDWNDKASSNEYKYNKPTGFLQKIDLSWPGVAAVEELGRGLVLLQTPRHGGRVVLVDGLLQQAMHARVG